VEKARAPLELKQIKKKFKPKVLLFQGKEHIGRRNLSPSVRKIKINF
jgi:hypothetical protein